MGFYALPRRLIRGATTFDMNIIRPTKKVKRTFWNKDFYHFGNQQRFCVSLHDTHHTEYNHCNTVWSIIMMFYIPPNTKANSSKMQHLLSPTQITAQGGTSGLGRQLMELFRDISELDKSRLTSRMPINFSNLNLPFHFAALHLNDGSRPLTCSGIPSRQKPEEK